MITVDFVVCVVNLEQQNGRSHAKTNLIARECHGPFRLSLQNLSVVKC